MRPDSFPDSSCRPTITVPTRGLTWFDMAALVISLGFFPVAVAAFYFLAIGGFPGGFAGSLIAAACVSAFVFLVGEARVSTRKIDVSSRGVTFHYVFNTEEGNWADLAPSPFLPQHGLWYLRRNRRSGSGREARTHALTLEQARAILSYPACPKWALNPAVSRALGIESPG